MPPFPPSPITSCAQSRPAPWLVKRAVSWGGMTLAELLDELLGQGENLASIKKLLGMTKE